MTEVDTKAEVVVPVTKVSIFVDGEEAASQDVDNATGVVVSGSTGSVTLPLDPNAQLSVAVYVLTRQNPTPIRPETAEEKKAREAEKAASAAFAAAVPSTVEKEHTKR